MKPRPRSAEVEEKSEEFQALMGTSSEQLWWSDLEAVDAALEEVPQAKGSEQCEERAQRVR